MSTPEKAFFEEDDWVHTPAPKRRRAAGVRDEGDGDPKTARKKQAEDKTSSADDEGGPDVSLPAQPTPEERAEYVMMRLEQFIREGRTISEGMPFKKWQAMAKTEIAIAVAQSESEARKDDPVTRRLLFMTAACLTTIGFWGAVVSIHKIAYFTTAVVCGVAGLGLLYAAGEWRFRKWWRKRNQRQRTERLANIENLNKRIKKLEQELKKQEKILGKKIQKARKKKIEKLTAPPPVPFDES